MKTIPFCTATIFIVIHLLMPKVTFAQDTQSQKDTGLLGLNGSHLDSHLHETELSYDRTRTVHADETLDRLERLSNQTRWNEEERAELFDLQTLDLQSQLQQHVSERIHYPVEMIEYQVEGTVMVEAAFDQKGSLISSKVIKGLHPVCDRASLEALEGFAYSRNSFYGAKRMIIPVAFILE